ncbi:hypothetical protein QY96_00400 [Bacillus thermotolerans]|uniref:Uncharacterized protein n=1 Tax=Bacillus thermotolerans TaxID=1221996 RepID=A0A0F5HMF3_BACTR|nr:hypothetical protein QY96_00400 [Bacillus thermotolerans]KKB34458.1 hypothetical protein QY95_03892 [Bacillus thermotolerans]
MVNIIQINFLITHVREIALQSTVLKALETLFYQGFEAFLLFLIF